MYMAMCLSYNQLGRIFFPHMVVANCNASCYWLHEITSKTMIAPVVFYPDSRLNWARLFLSQHGRFHAVSFETASGDTQSINLARNVSKFYAWQVVSLMNQQQKQNLSLKLDLLSTIRNNKVDHARWKTRNISQVESFCYFSFFAVHVRRTAYVQRKFEGVYLIKNHRNNL